MRLGTGRISEGRYEMFDAFFTKCTSREAWLSGRGRGAYGLTAGPCGRLLGPFTESNWRLVKSRKLGWGSSDRQRQRLDRQRRNVNGYPFRRGLWHAFAGWQCGKRHRADGWRQFLWRDLQPDVGQFRPRDIHAVGRVQHCQLDQPGRSISGYGTGSSGTYNLSGNGQFSVPNAFVGNNGTGTFNQFGGAARLAPISILATAPARAVRTTSSGSGSLSTGNYEYVGFDSTGTFTQLGGTTAPTV